MKVIKSTEGHPQFELKRVAVYEEALHLFTLSRKISKSNTIPSFWNCQNEKEIATHLSENITTSALSLPMFIAEAMVTVDCFKRMNYQKIIGERIEGILRLCTKLENLYNDHDQRVKQLKSSADKLQSGFKKWSPSLIQQN